MFSKKLLLTLMVTCSVFTLLLGCAREDDVKITSEVQREITSANIPNNAIQVQSINGVVMLTGTVATVNDEQRVINIARSVPGVKRVDSQLTIAETTYSDKATANTSNTTANMDRYNTNSGTVGNTSTGTSNVVPGTGVTSGTMNNPSTVNRATDRTSTTTTNTTTGSPTSTTTTTNPSTTTSTYPSRTPSSPGATSNVPNTGAPASGY